MIRNFLGILLLFILLSFICGLISAGPLSNLAQDTMFAPLSAVEAQAAQQALSSQFGKTFPSSASDFYRANQGDSAYWLRISVAPNEINQLFGGSNFFTCRFPLQPNFRPVFEFSRLLDGQEQARLGWWTPADASIRTYSGGECTGTDYRLFRMFVDQSNPSRWTVYMEVVRL
jgi:hypothetical protein